MDVECNIFTVLVSIVCTAFNANCTINTLVMPPMAEEDLQVSKLVMA